MPPYHRDQYVLFMVEEHEIQILLSDAQEQYRNWLTYLGPELVADISDEVLQELQNVKTQRLPSGALFLRSKNGLLRDDMDAFFNLDLEHDFEVQ